MRYMCVLRISLSNGPCVLSKQVTAAAATSKSHYTKYYIIMWSYNLRQGQDV